jgi:hypothetical protein
VDDRSEPTKLILENHVPEKLYLEKINKLPPRLQHIPALDRGRPPRVRGPGVRSDNSNTQFAALALWAARRRGLPLERTLALVVKRFRTSQSPTGGWGYGYGYTVGSGHNWFGSPTMTCAGLLGLAVGHGLAADIKGGGKGDGKDEAVARALKALSTGIGQEPKWSKRLGQDRFNLYLLWSVERVGVLYRLGKIGKVDWYTWGVDILLEHQLDDGSWCGYGYAGSDKTTDTCLALLFLKRVNLTQDLTQKLRLDVPDGE